MLTLQRRQHCMRCQLKLLPVRAGARCTVSHKLAGSVASPYPPREEEIPGNNNNADDDDDDGGGDDDDDHHQHGHQQLHHQNKMN
eukprot:5571226-Amphidinium_carterae.3